MEFGVDSTDLHHRRRAGDCHHDAKGILLIESNDVNVIDYHRCQTVCDQFVHERVSTILKVTK